MPAFPERSGLPLHAFLSHQFSRAQPGWLKPAPTAKLRKPSFRLFLRNFQAKAQQRPPKDHLRYAFTKISISFLLRIFTTPDRPQQRRHGEMPCQPEKRLLSLASKHLFRLLTVDSVGKQKWRHLLVVRATRYGCAPAQVHEDIEVVAACSWEESIQVFNFNNCSRSLCSGSYLLDHKLVFHAVCLEVGGRGNL